MQREELRRTLNGILDSRVVGHNPKQVIAIGDAIHRELTEAQAAALESRPHRRFDAVETVEQVELPSKYVFDASLKAHARAQGLDAGLLSQPRLQGTWCVWVSEDRARDRQTVVSHSAISSGTLLRAQLNEVLDSAPRGSSRPASSFDVGVVHRLFDTVSDWEAAILGHTTLKTMSAAQIKDLGDPDLEARALAGDRQSRQEGFLEIKQREVAKTLALGRDVSWSLWTSKGHVDDRTLVVTREASDAHAYHQLHPDPRTRYASLDGHPSPLYGKVLDRVVSLMPAGSTIIVATDRSREGRALEASTLRLAPRHPDRAFSVHEPKLGLSWKEHLQDRQRTVGIQR